MKVRYILLISFVILLLGYIAGQYMPWDLLHPNITSNDISMNDYYTRLVSVVGALATILATLVALFKEDIRRLYEFALLNVDFKHPDVISEILDSSNSGESDNLSSSLAAKKYELVISVCNKGKLAARGCQIYLEHLSYKTTSYPQPKECLTSGQPLQWIGKTELTTIIPSTAKTFVSIIEIHSPQSEIVTAEKKHTNPKPQIKIAGVDINSQDLNTKYFCTFMLYSENANPVQFKLEIDWNGKWEHRLSEMKNCIKIKKVN